MLPQVAAQLSLGEACSVDVEPYTVTGWRRLPNRATWTILGRLRHSYVSASSLPSASRTIGTLAAVVALTLAACGSGTSDTTTTEDTRGWSDEAFRDVMAYCQADEIGSCASLVISFRDVGKCSVEATYRLVDFVTDITDTSPEAFDNLLRDQLHPAGDCLGFVTFEAFDE